jgi:hypothetical protein
LRDPGACVDWWIARVHNEEDPVHKCLEGAQTCEQIGACVHDKPDARAAAYCVGHAGILTGCDGDRLVTCGEDDARESHSEDCAALGAHCEERKIAGGLLVRACFSPRLCPDSAPQARCDGDSVVTCEDGAVERFACAAGMRCEEQRGADGERMAACVSKEVATRCDEPNSRYCDGNRLVECDLHGRRGETRVIDCGALGLHCHGRGTRAACVTSEGAACEPSIPHCAGDTLGFCAAGHPMRVSCKEIGLGPCDPAARGAEAACRAPAPP